MRILTEKFPAKLSAKLYTAGQASPLSPISNRSISFTSSYSKAVAQVLLATTAGVHTGSASLEERDITLVQATYIPWSPLGVFTGLVFVYAALAGFVCLDVWRNSNVVMVDIGNAGGEGSPKGRLKVAAGRLTDPGKVVYDLIGVTSGLKMTKRVSEEVKLGLGTRRDGNFGVCA